MRLHELLTKKARLEHELAGKNRELAIRKRINVDKTKKLEDARAELEVAVAEQVHDCGTQAIEAMQREGMVRVGKNVQAALRYAEEGMHPKAALVRAAIERDPAEYIGELPSDEFWRLMSEVHLYDSTTAAEARAGYLRAIAENVAPRLGEMGRSLVRAENERGDAMVRVYDWAGGKIEVEGTPEEMAEFARITGTEGGALQWADGRIKALADRADKAAQPVRRELLLEKCREYLATYPTEEKRQALDDLALDLGISPEEIREEVARLRAERYGAIRPSAAPPLPAADDPYPEIAAIDAARMPWQDGRRWEDSMLTQVGVQIWERTYRAGTDDAQTAAHCDRVAAAWAAGSPMAGEAPRDTDRQQTVSSIVFFAAKWAVHAFQRVTTTHTYGAALMCSDADRASLETIETQWHAFMVQVPNGLLRAEGGALEYNRVLVTMHDAGASLVLLDQEHSHPARIVVQGERTLADLLSDDGAGSLLAEKHPEAARAAVCAKRLVAGLLLAMQHADNFKDKTYPARVKNQRGRKLEEPAHRVVLVGKPITVDCRRGVADYIAHGPRKGKHGPPSVQVLVRGHYRRQVVGVGRTGRKVIWIQPFWRGPDDAPIFTHPKQLAGGERPGDT